MKYKNIREEELKNKVENFLKENGIELLYYEEIEAIIESKDIKNKHTFIKSLKQSDYLIILNKQTNVLEYAIKLSILEENR